MAAYAEPRTLRYFVSDREPLAAKRIGGALNALENASNGRLVVQRERRAANADFIWLNTPSKAHKAACASVESYNHVVGARQALEHKGRFSDLAERCGESALWSRSFASVKELGRLSSRKIYEAPGWSRTRRRIAVSVSGSPHARKTYFI